MTILFRPDTVMFGDAAGFGQWRIGHYLEHKAMIPLAFAQTVPVVVPDYDLGYWSDDPEVMTSWLTRHYQVHLLHRQASNVGGIDLSAVDLSKEEDWYIWMDDHRLEHQELRAFYGIT